MNFYKFTSFLLVFFLSIITMMNYSCAADHHKTKEGPQIDSVENIQQIQTKLAVGAENLANYIPMIKGKRTALVVNHSSRIGDKHLVDTLLALDINIVKVFSPEHGFKGIADDGEKINDAQLDAKQNIPLVSLYGKKRKPASGDMEDIEIMIFDIQDVGARFYTYISTMHYVMEACAENGIPLIILDRPNPHGHYIDGPILEPKFKSFIGMHEIPVIHGMTVGELAQMINGEAWLKDGIKCELTVIKNTNYTHNTPYVIPVAPSPNLPDELAVLLYPSLCFFEATPLSIGRGTDRPFTKIGHPSCSRFEYYFVPKPSLGSKNPKLNGEKCYGVDFSPISTENFRARGELDLSWILDFYIDWKGEESFFNENGGFDLRAGTDVLREQIETGMSAEEIRSSWQNDLKKFNQKRKKYLLYPDFE